MVGVPGKSKGCNTCKKRKVACSLETPQCSRCIQANLTCAGYQRERVFITGHLCGRLAAQKFAVKSDHGLFAEGKSSKVSSPFKQGSNSWASRSTSTLHLTKSISPKATFRQQILNAFLCSYVDDSQRLSRQLPTQKRSWLMLIPELTKPTTALETSILAVSIARIGRLNNDEQLTRESLRLYGRGLVELQKALWDHRLMYREETLAACLSLLFYELMECPAGSRLGYLSHTFGCESLIRLRGPEAFCSLLAHHIFLDFRLHAIVNAIKQRRHTFLSEPEWTNLAWKSFPKTPIHQLLDTMAFIPDLLVQTDRIRGTECNNLLLTSETVDLCKRVDATATSFYKDLESITLSPLYWPTFSNVDNDTADPELGKVFPVSYHFMDLQTAHICMLYWMTLVITSSILEDMYDHLSEIKKDEETTSQGSNILLFPENEDDTNSSFQSSPVSSAAIYLRSLPTLPHSHNIVSLVKDICQSVEYCLLDEMRCSGPGSALTPLYVAILVFKGNLPQCRRELVWARDAMEKVQERGYRLMKFVQA